MKKLILKDDMKYGDYVQARLCVKCNAPNKIGDIFTNVCSKCGGTEFKTITGRWRYTEDSSWFGIKKRKVMHGFEPTCQEKQCEGLCEPSHDFLDAEESWDAHDRKEKEPETHKHKCTEDVCAFEDEECPVVIQEKEDYVGVHRTHCCVIHGCKYGDKQCPVARGDVKQDYTCEGCFDEGWTTLDDVKAKVKEQMGGMLPYVSPEQYEKHWADIPLVDVHGTISKRLQDDATLRLLETLGDLTVDLEVNDARNAMSVAETRIRRYENEMETMNNTIDSQQDQIMSLVETLDTYLEKDVIKKPKTNTHIVLEELLVMIDALRYGDAIAVGIVKDRAEQIFNSQETQIDELFRQNHELKQRDKILSADSGFAKGKCESIDRDLIMAYENIDSLTNQVKDLQKIPNDKLYYETTIADLRRYSSDEHQQQTIDGLNDVIQELNKEIDAIQRYYASNRLPLGGESLNKCDKMPAHDDYFFAEKPSVLDKLHYIENSNDIFNPIYNIHYCNTGVGIIFYDPTKDTGKFREALTVYKYYETFEDCIDAEYDRLVERESENQTDESKDKSFNALCLGIYEEYHNATYGGQWDPSIDNGQLVDVVDIVFNRSGVGFNLSGDDNIYDLMKDYVLEYGSSKYWMGEET